MGKAISPSKYVKKPKLKRVKKSEAMKRLWGAGQTKVGSQDTYKEKS
tara:strand:+ start:295 stop:435 length:141 start_codon:yes stop_codon:yes gene_type:complete